jgi:hypothetical protein
MNFVKNTALYFICTVHALLVFCIGLLLFVTKWFPYGSGTRWLREWLYRFF